MKRGQLRVWWYNGEHYHEEVDSLLDGLWLLHTRAMLEVNDSSIDCNAGGLEFFDEKFLLEEYECEDGFTSFYDSEGRSDSDILDDIYDAIGRDSWSRLSRGHIESWLVANGVEGEIREIKIV